MGNRRNIQVRDSVVIPHPIYLYVHWHADDLAQILADALDRARSRWDDGAYLMRVIASDIFDAVGLYDLTGAGLTTIRILPDHPDLIVDIDAGTVTQENDDTVLTFEQFIADPERLGTS